MRKTIILLGPEQRQKARRLIEYLPDDGPAHRVIIEPCEDTRSIRQNRYYFGPLMDVMVKDLGMSKAELHYDHKYRFLVPIYIRDIPSYAEMVESVKRVKKYSPSDAEQLKKWIIEKTSTTTATVKQFAEFLESVKQHAISLRIRLPADIGDL